MVFHASGHISLLTGPFSPHTAGEQSWLHSFSIPRLCSDFPEDLFSVLPPTWVLFSPVHKGREKKGNARCVKRIIFYFILEVAVNIDRRGKKRVCICTMRYRNISIGILLYSPFPYPQQHADKSRTAILYTVLQLSALSSASPCQSTAFPLFQL